MKYDRVAKRAVVKLRGASLEAFNFIENLESAELNAIPELCSALSSPVISLVGFSCAFGGGDEKDITIIERGFFEKRTRAKTEELVSSLRGLGKEVKMTIFIEDLELRRVWGWSRSQEEITAECEFQIELARESGEVPPGVDVRLWSTVEPDAVSAGSATHEEVLVWARESGQSRILDIIARHRQTYPRNKGVSLASLRATSVTGLAGYSLVGEALEILYPDSILVQPAHPWRDHLMGYRRKRVLPIIHPWR
ncbi:MAG: hypothetical protein AAB660_01665 [Patescibacteria group bacterium]|mgnify:CR=1 FL=1